MTTREATPTATSYAPSFEDIDGYVTSALDAIDGAAATLFSSDEHAAIDDRTTTKTTRTAAKWADVRWDACATNVKDVLEVIEASRETEKEKRRVLRRILGDSSGDAKATTMALTEEIKRLNESREEVFGKVLDGLMTTIEGVFALPDPTEALQASARWRRERDAMAVERDAAMKRAEAVAGTGANASELREKLAEETRSVIRVMEAKKRAAETSADAARADAAKASQKLEELHKLYDESQSKLFELEERVESDAARQKAEREELRALGEELRERESALNQAAQEHRRNEIATAIRSDNDDTALREKLAVKERMVSQLASSLEAAEASAKATRAERDDEKAKLELQILQLRDELAKSINARPVVDVSAHEAEIAQLKSRVKMLQEIAGVSANDDGDTEETSTSAAAMESLRERNKKASAELVIARREREEAITKAEIAQSAQAVVERKYAEAAAMVTTLEQDLSIKLAKIVEDGINASSAGADAKDSDLLAILTSQRDRFKRRVGELDERVARLEQEKVAAEDALKKKENDSIALFEKLQYVQNYYAKNASTTGRTTILRVDDAGVPVAPTAAQNQSAKNARYSCGAVSVNIESEKSAAAIEGMRRRAARYGCFAGAGAGDEIPGGDEAGLVSRYRRKYLARLNPFAAFRRDAQDESVGALPLHDRVGFTGGKLLMTSRATRATFSLYIIFLHLYLFTRAFASS